MTNIAVPDPGLGSISALRRSIWSSLAGVDDSMYEKRGR